MCIMSPRDRGVHAHSLVENMIQTIKCQNTASVVVNFKLAEVRIALTVMNVQIKRK